MEDNGMEESIRFNFIAVEESILLYTPATRTSPPSITGVAFLCSDGNIIGRARFNESIPITGVEQTAVALSLDFYPLFGVFSADYELLCKILGHVGPNAMRPCIYCLMKRESFKRAKDDVRADEKAPRTIALIDADYCAFCAEVDSFPKDKQKAKAKKLHQQHNSINAPKRLDIKENIRTVIPCPSVHIDLGVTKKLWDVSKRQLEEVDLLNDSPANVTSKTSILDAERKLKWLVPALGGHR